MQLLTNKTTIFLLLLAALGVRLLAMEQIYVIANDGTHYIKLAKLYYLEGNFNELLRNYPYAAFFSLFIIPFYKIIGNWILAGQLVSVICGSLTVIPLYLLARKIFDEKVALFASIFYIICPDLAKYSAEVLRDIPFIFFYMMALWWGYKGIKNGKMIFLGLSALFIVLSALLRVEGLILFISLSIFLFWDSIKNNIPWKKTLNSFGVFLASGFCILALIGTFAIAKTNINPKQVLRIKAISKSIENNTLERIEKKVEKSSLPPAGKNLFYLAKDYRFILYLSHIFYKTTKVFNILFILFLFGLLIRKKKRYRRDEILLFVLYACFISAFLLYFNNLVSFSTRYTLPLVVPSLIWTGVGFVELKERVSEWLRKKEFSFKKPILHWITALLLLMICVPLLCMAWAPHRKDKLELKEIGLWLKDHGYAHSVIIGQHEFTRLAFYAEGELVPLPPWRYRGIIQFARKKGANLLIINRKTIDNYSPHFIEKVSAKDLEKIDIPGIKTPYYATTVFRLKGIRENKVIESDHKK